MDVFGDVSLFMVLIQRKPSIYTLCRHHCPSLPLSFGAALWCHCCELKMNLYLRSLHYDKVACSGKKPRENAKSYVGYWVWFGMRGIIVCKWCDFEIVQDAGGEFNASGLQNGHVGDEMRYIYSSSANFLIQLVRYDTFNWYPACCWLTNTKWPSLHFAQSQCTAWMTSLKKRFRACCEESLRLLALLLHHTPPLPLRPVASRSKLSSAQVVPTVQPSNTRTNTLSGGKTACTRFRRYC